MRVKRRKTLEKNPRLTILSVVKETGEVECRLEISNKNTITFKFSLENDKPQEIAESLVRIESGVSNVDVIFFSANIISQIFVLECCFYFVYVT